MPSRKVAEILVDPLDIARGAVRRVAESVAGVRTSGQLVPLREVEALQADVMVLYRDVSALVQELALLRQSLSMKRETARAV